MKCPECSYVSHDYLDACRKCNMALVEFKQKFNLMVLRPGELDLGELVDVGVEGIIDRDRFRIAGATFDMPHGTSHMTNSPAKKVSMAKPQGVEAGLKNIPTDMEVDIQFDTDNSAMSTEPGELTRTFYVPEELAKQMFNTNLPDRKVDIDKKPTEPKMDIQLGTDDPTMSTETRGLTKMFYVGLDEMLSAPEVDPQLNTDNPAPLAENAPECSQATPDETVPQANSAASAQYAQDSPMPTLDMSVGKLDDCFNEFDDIQLDTTEIDRDIELAFYLPSTAETPSAVDYGAPEKAQEERTLDTSNNLPSLSEKRNASTETDEISAPDTGGTGEIS